MRLSNVVANTDDALDFQAAIFPVMKDAFSRKGYILGQAHLALCERGDFVEIPGARWYSIAGRVGDRNGRVKEFRKEFAARIGPDTNREDIFELAWSVVNETDEEFKKSAQEEVLDLG